MWSLRATRPGSTVRLMGGSPDMNLLFLVPYTPTLVRTRPYNLLRALRRHGHTLTLATLWENAGERAALQAFEADGLRVIAARLGKAQIALNLARALATPLPLQARYCWQPGLWGLVGQALTNERFDVLHVEHLRGSAYALAARRAFPRQAVVWDSVDCISLLFELASRNSQGGFGRWATRLDLPRTRRFEGRLARLFERVLVTAENDRAALQKLAGEPVRPEHITVLPNGVDLDYFTPGAWPRRADEVIFSGKLSYHANVNAAAHLIREVMPRVWSLRPQVRLRLVGKDPDPLLRSLAEGEPRIEVTGAVPDLGEHLRRAAVAVAPLTYGVGIQNKVLEAMACATPVIAYPQAVSALQVDGGAACVVQEPGAMADAILRLLADPALAEQIGRAGRRYVEQHHDWAQIAGRLEEIYAQAVDGKGG